MVADGWLEDVETSSLIELFQQVWVGIMCATHPTSFLLFFFFFLWESFLLLKFDSCNQKKKKKDYLNHNSSKDEHTILLNYKILKVYLDTVYY